MLVGSTLKNVASSLSIVRSEVDSSLDQAATHLEQYVETNQNESFKAFLGDIQQVRGTFKLLDFRSGERFCEEIAETSRLMLPKGLSDHTLEVFSRNIMLLKRFVEIICSGDDVAPGLLLPLINEVRQVRGDKALPDAYFFMVNLRPKIKPPQALSGADNVPYRRVRQLYQVGLLSMIQGKGRQGAAALLARSISRVEKAARGHNSWIFWYAALAATDGLQQKQFHFSHARLVLLRVIDGYVRKIEKTQGAFLNEKLPDWLLKELLYIATLADDVSPVLKQAKKDFQLPSDISEHLLLEVREQLSGPDKSALDSISLALSAELETVKDLLDLTERSDGSDERKSDICTSLQQIADTLGVVNMPEIANETRAISKQLSDHRGNLAIDILRDVADQVLHVEQAIKSLASGGKGDANEIDPLSLMEAKISVISESQSALSVTKRALASYIDSNGDKMHITNVGKVLAGVSGGLFFLNQAQAAKLLSTLAELVVSQLIEKDKMPQAARMDLLADAISALEFYIDSLVNQDEGSPEAISLAQQSIEQLKLAS